MADDLECAIEQLSQGQIDCLLLVHQHLTSKEIGPRLGISSHTVDQRIRRALPVLGCNRRAQAAQLVASRITDAAMFWSPPDRDEPFVEYLSRRVTRERRPIQLPFATNHYPRNFMVISQRLLWIVIIGSGASLSVGVYLAGLESLARLLL